MVFQEPMTSLNPVMRIGPQIEEAIRAHEPIISAGLRGKKDYLKRWNTHRCRNRKFALANTLINFPAACGNAR